MADGLCFMKKIQLGGHRKGTAIKGYTLVDTEPTAGIWVARIRVNNKVLWLGTFKKKKAAIKARQNAELKYFGGFKNESN